jgi:hypothetical protein
VLGVVEINVPQPARRWLGLPTTGHPLRGCDATTPVGQLPSRYEAVPASSLLVVDPDGAILLQRRLPAMV